VGKLWLIVIAVSAICAFGPVHRNDLPHHWSGDVFLTTVLGPLVVFRWPYPAIQLHVSDYVISISFTAILLVLTALHIFRPTRWTLWVLVVLMAFWLFLGLSATYAWV
jgi:hypothetical protein